jgi:hypothetical protein
LREKPEIVAAVSFLSEASFLSAFLLPLLKKIPDYYLIALCMFLFFEGE